MKNCLSRFQSNVLISFAAIIIGIGFFLIAGPSSVLAQSCSGTIVDTGIVCSDLVLSGCEGASNSFNCSSPNTTSRQYTGCTPVTTCSGKPYDYSCTFSDHCDPPPGNPDPTFGPTSPPGPTSIPAPQPGCTIANSSGTSVFTQNSSGSFSTTPVDGAVYAALAYTPPGGSPTALCSAPVALPGYNVCPRSINFTQLGTYTW